MSPGEKLTPALKLVRCLAEGGMGSVWVAEHESLSTEVAVKLMSPVAMEDMGMLERFRHEAIAAAQIKSPHIAQVFDHGITEDGSPYIVMELLEGEDLQRRIERMGTLEPLEVVQIVHQVAKALTRVHSVGIVHRDIKSSNIFLQDIDGELHVKVLDFGIAKMPSKKGDDVSISGLVVGTPYYMSPEQLKDSKHVDAQSDLWSLAVVAYEALTATFPFMGRSLPELIVAVTAGKFSQPSALREDLSPEVDAWFVRAFERLSSARFASARDLSDTFEEAVTGEVVPRSRSLPTIRLLPLMGDRQFSATAPTLPGVSAAAFGAAAADARIILSSPPVDLQAAGREGGRRGELMSQKTAIVVLFVAIMVGVLIGLFLR